MGFYHRRPVPSFAKSVQYIDLGYGIEPVDAAVRNDVGPQPETFQLKDIWMFGFFPGTADHALRLGPYISRSSHQENNYMDTGGHMQRGKS